MFSLVAGWRNARADQTTAEDLITLIMMRQKRLTGSTCSVRQETDGQRRRAESCREQDPLEYCTIMNRMRKFSDGVWIAGH